MDESDNRSPAVEEIGQTGEEGVALEESMSGSPSNVQDELSGPNVTAESGNRPNGTHFVFPNGIKGFLNKPFSIIDISFIKLFGDE